MIQMNKVLNILQRLLVVSSYDTLIFPLHHINICHVRNDMTRHEMICSNNSFFLL